MSRKHYIAVAAIIEFGLGAADTDDGLDVVTAMAHRFASMFNADSPRFDRGRFLAACGLND